MKQITTPNFTAEEFNQLVIQALDTLPDFFKEQLNNVDVVVVDWPTLAEMRSIGVTNRNHLLGLYQGVPLTKRTTGYNMTLPDKISIFRMPIERICHTPQTVIKQVRRTVLHELAHHFGISDERLRELGAY